MDILIPTKQPNLGGHMMKFIPILALAIFAATTVNAQSEAPAKNDDRDAFHAALEECASTNGIVLGGPGKRPSEDERALIDACLKEKGIAPPQHRRGPPPEEGGRRPPRGSSGSNAVQ